MLAGAYFLWVAMLVLCLLIVGVGSNLCFVVILRTSTSGAGPVTPLVLAVVGFGPVLDLFGCVISVL